MKKALEIGFGLLFLFVGGYFSIIYWNLFFHGDSVSIIGTIAYTALFIMGIWLLRPWLQHTDPAAVTYVKQKTYRQILQWVLVLAPGIVPVLDAFGLIRHIGLEVLSIILLMLFVFLPIGLVANSRENARPWWVTVCVLLVLNILFFAFL